MNPPATVAKPLPSQPGPAPAPAPGVEVGVELLLLPDGRILAHHLTPELAALLQTACATDLPVQ